jgi:hypothetical protein
MKRVDILGHRRIRVPEDKKLGTSQVSKPRELIITIHQRRDAWRKSMPSEEGPIGGRPLENRGLAYRGFCGRRNFALRNCEPLNPDKEDSAIVEACASGFEEWNHRKP